jgi:hypothetical protein
LGELPRKMANRLSAVAFFEKNKKELQQIPQSFSLCIFAKFSILRLSLIEKNSSRLCLGV